MKHLILVQYNESDNNTSNFQNLNISVINKLNMIFNYFDNNIIYAI